MITIVDFPLLSADKEVSTSTALNSIVANVFIIGINVRDIVSQVLGWSSGRRATRIF